MQTKTIRWQGGCRSIHYNNGTLPCLRLNLSFIPLTSLRSDNETITFFRKTLYKTIYFLVAKTLGSFNTAAANEIARNFNRNVRVIRMHLPCLPPVLFVTKSLTVIW